MKKVFMPFTQRFIRLRPWVLWSVLGWISFSVAQPLVDDLTSEDVNEMFIGSLQVLNIPVPAGAQKVHYAFVPYLTPDAPVLQGSEHTQYAFLERGLAERSRLVFGLLRWPRCFHESPDAFYLFASARPANYHWSNFNHTCTIMPSTMDWGHWITIPPEHEEHARFSMGSWMPVAAFVPHLGDVLSEDGHPMDADPSAWMVLLVGFGSSVASQPPPLPNLSGLSESMKQVALWMDDYMCDPQALLASATP